MEGIENTINQISRTMWSVLDYLTGAVTRFLRPEFLNQGNKEEENEEEEDKEENQATTSKETTREVQQQVQFRVQSADLQWEEGHNIKDGNDEEKDVEKNACASTAWEKDDSDKEKDTRKHACASTAWDSGVKERTAKDKDQKLQMRNNKETLDSSLNNNSKPVKVTCYDFAEKENSFAFTDTHIRTQDFVLAGSMETDLDAERSKNSQENTNKPCNEKDCFSNIMRNVQDGNAEPTKNKCYVDVLELEEHSVQCDAEEKADQICKDENQDVCKQQDICGNEKNKIQIEVTDQRLENDCEQLEKKIHKNEPELNRNSKKMSENKYKMDVDLLTDLMDPTQLKQFNKQEHIKTGTTSEMASDHTQSQRPNVVTKQDLKGDISQLEAGTGNPNETVVTALKFTAKVVAEDVKKSAKLEASPYKEQIATEEVTEIATETLQKRTYQTSLEQMSMKQQSNTAEKELLHKASCSEINYISPEQVDDIESINEMQSYSWQDKTKCLTEINDDSITKLIVQTNDIFTEPTAELKSTSKDTQRFEQAVPKSDTSKPVSDSSVAVVKAPTELCKQSANIMDLVFHVSETPTVIGECKVQDTEKKSHGLQGSSGFPENESELTELETKIYSPKSTKKHKRSYKKEIKLSEEINSMAASLGVTEMVKSNLTRVSEEDVMTSTEIEIRSHQHPIDVECIVRQDKMDQFSLEQEPVPEKLDDAEMTRLLLKAPSNEIKSSEHLDKTTVALIEKVPSSTAMEMDSIECAIETSVESKTKHMVTTKNNFSEQVHEMFEVSVISNYTKNEAESKSDTPEIKAMAASTVEEVIGGLTKESVNDEKISSELEKNLHEHPIEGENVVVQEIMSQRFLEQGIIPNKIADEGFNELLLRAQLSETKSVSSEQVDETTVASNDKVPYLTILANTESALETSVSSMTKVMEKTKSESSTSEITAISASVVEEVISGLTKKSEEDVKTSDLEKSSHEHPLDVKVLFLPDTVDQCTNDQENVPEKSVDEKTDELLLKAPLSEIKLISSKQRDKTTMAFTEKISSSDLLEMDKTECANEINVRSKTDIMVKTKTNSSEQTHEMIKVSGMSNYAISELKCEQGEFESVCSELEIKAKSATVVEEVLNTLTQASEEDVKTSAELKKISHEGDRNNVLETIEQYSTEQETVQKKVANETVTEFLMKAPLSQIELTSTEQIEDAIVSLVEKMVSSTVEETGKTECVTEASVDSKTELMPTKFNSTEQTHEVFESSCMSNYAANEQAKTKSTTPELKAMAALVVEGVMSELTNVSEKDVKTSEALEKTSHKFPKDGYDRVLQETMDQYSLEEETIQEKSADVRMTELLQKAPLSEIKVISSEQVNESTVASNVLEMHKTESTIENLDEFNTILMKETKVSYTEQICDMFDESGMSNYNTKEQDISESGTAEIKAIAASVVEEVISRLTKDLKKNGKTSEKRLLEHPIDGEGNVLQETMDHCSLEQDTVQEKSAEKGINKMPLKSETGTKLLDEIKSITASEAVKEETLRELRKESEETPLTSEIKAPEANEEKNDFQRNVEMLESYTSFMNRNTTLLINTVENERKLQEETVNNKSEICEKIDRVKKMEEQVLVETVNGRQMSLESSNEMSIEHKEVHGGKIEIHSKRKLKEKSHSELNRENEKIAEGRKKDKLLESTNLLLPEVSSLDFTVQKSKIAVKNPLVRPPKKPRLLINMPSVEPLSFSHPSHPSPLLSVPSKGVVGFKLPGLGAGLPALKKTESGRNILDVQSETTQERLPAPQKTNTDSIKDCPKQGQIPDKPKWTPPKLPGMGNPMMMAELKNKLKKTGKE